LVVFCVRSVKSIKPCFVQKNKHVFIDPSRRDLKMPIRKWVSENLSWLGVDGEGAIDNNDGVVSPIGKHLSGFTPIPIGDMTLSGHYHCHCHCQVNHVASPAKYIWSCERFTCLLFMDVTFHHDGNMSLNTVQNLK
jgi:hypothetical protein